MTNNIYKERIELLANSLEKGETVDNSEMEELTVYLNEKDSLGEPLSESEEHLMSLISAFTPDDDNEVRLGDYVDDREMASAEFGYDIYDKKEMLHSLDRRLSNNEEISDAELVQLKRIWQFNVLDHNEIKQQMKKAGL